jgi:large subunit ribosomal protein L23
MKQIYDTLISPVNTEKAFKLMEDGKYVFLITKDASKSIIKQAITKVYNVTVTKVNIINIKGKKKRFKQGKLGKLNDRRKAVVTLEKGAKIEIV